MNSMHKLFCKFLPTQKLLVEMQLLILIYLFIIPACIFINAKLHLKCLSLTFVQIQSFYLCREVFKYFFFKMFQKGKSCRLNPHSLNTKCRIFVVHETHRSGKISLHIKYTTVYSNKVLLFSIIVPFFLFFPLQFSLLS